MARYRAYRRRWGRATAWSGTFTVPGAREPAPGLLEKKTAVRSSAREDRHAGLLAACLPCLDLNFDLE